MFSFNANRLKVLSTFSYPYVVEKALFWGYNFQNGDFDGFYTFRGSLNPKITFLAVDPCVCKYVCINSVIQKQITAETSNLVFYICNKCR